MNNCVQKEEVKNEKEKEHGWDESVLKKAEPEHSITDQTSNTKKKNFTREKKRRKKARGWHALSEG